MINLIKQRYIGLHVENFRVLIKILCTQENFTITWLQKIVRTFVQIILFCNYQNQSYNYRSIFLVFFMDGGGGGGEGVLYKILSIYDRLYFCQSLNKLINLKRSLTLKVNDKIVSKLSKRFMFPLLIRIYDHEKNVNATKKKVANVRIVFDIFSQ